MPGPNPNRLALSTLTKEGHLMYTNSKYKESLVS
jgi:hypothetical protein